MKAKRMILFILISVVLLLGFGSWVCYAQKKPTIPPARSEVKHADWAKNAVIYEVNVRQYSKEGTFKAFEKDLPRLKKLGVNILWIMPVQPIGILDRKGSLGSYYSIQDYRAINPEFGGFDDFKSVVNRAHSLGLKVIIDWVANHSSKDNDLLKTHPEYYMKDSLGRLVSPYDWTDVARLDYGNPATCKYMSETMQWWVTETDIDGFRCDVASMVPTSFWNALRPELEKIKPVFMLAEADIPELQQKGFDMTYDWKFHHVMNSIAKGKQNANAVAKHFNRVDSIFPGNSYLMEFTSNHDENTWNGTEYERLGEGAQTFAALSATINGMMLIYTGQESAFKRRFKFFEKDTTDWGNYPLTDFYQKLISLKHRNKALWNGEEGGKFQRISTNRDTTVFAFTREKGNQKVLVLCNLSAKPVDVKFDSKLMMGSYLEIFTNEKRTFGEKPKMSLTPWQYLIFEKTK